MGKKDNKNIFITTKNSKNKKIYDLYKKKGLFVLVFTCNKNMMINK